MAIKAKTQMDERRAFIDNANRTVVAQQQSIWSIDDLKTLSLDELVNRFETINAQSKFMMWMVLLHIRNYFPSDIKYGQYLNDLRDKYPGHPICECSQQNRFRYVAAARFMLRHKVTDIAKLGIGISAIYELSRPVNESIADIVFQDIKRKKIPYKDVLRKIEQAKAVLTIEQPERIDYKNNIDDVNNVVIEPTLIDTVGFPIEQINLENEIKIIESNHQRRMEILATLPPVGHDVSEHEIIEELKIIHLIYDGHL